MLLYIGTYLHLSVGTRAYHLSEEKDTQPPHRSSTIPIRTHAYNIRAWALIRVFSVCRFILRERVQFNLRVLLRGLINKLQYNII